MAILGEGLKLGKRALVLSLALLALAGGVSAARAEAQAITGPPAAQPPMPPGAFVRGLPMTAGVTIPATEGAIFGYGAPAVSISAAGSCTTSIGAICIAQLVPPSVVVVVLDDLDGTLFESLNVTITPTMQPAAIGLSSVEGSPLFSGAVAFIHAAQAIGLTGGGTQQTAAILPEVGFPVTDAQIAIATTGPAPGTMVTQGSYATYTATLTRGGNTAGTTNVGIFLDPINASGTSASGSPVNVTFAPGETVKMVEFAVTVPFTTTPGAAPVYRARAVYDPTGTDGFPIDTERGANTSFTIAAGTPPPPTPTPPVTPTTAAATTPSTSTTTTPATKKCKKGKKRNKRGKCVKKKKTRKKK